LSNQASGRQPAALFNTILAYAQHIENLDVLKAAVSRIAQEHTSLNIQAEHYPIVGHHLIKTFRELTGALFTAELESCDFALCWRSLNADVIYAGVFSQDRLFVNYL